MRRDVWHLYSVNIVIPANHTIESMLPVHCHQGIAVIIVLDAHTVEGVDELVIVLCIAEDLLMVYTSHHDMKDTGA